MSVSLNFSKKDKEKIIEFLEKFEKIETKTEFEESRAKISGSIVTLYNTGKVSIQGKNVENAKNLLLKEIHGESKLVFGIDETGRGEQAGPMVIAGVLGESGKLRELRDSKKTSNVFEKSKIVEENCLAIASVSFNADFIDYLRANGINLNIIEAETINSFAGLFQKFGKKIELKADGSPIKECVKEIEFIVKGDDSEPVIGAASVIAKRIRDSSFNKKKRESWQMKSKN